MNSRETHYFDHKKFYSLFNLTGMTQGEFGKRVGVSGASISQYITGKNTPCEKTLNKMCVVLQCSYGELKKAKHGAVGTISMAQYDSFSKKTATIPPPTLLSYQQDNTDAVKALVAVANDDNAAVIMRAIKELMK